MEKNNKYGYQSEIKGHSNGMIVTVETFGMKYEMSRKGETSRIFE